MNIEKLNTEKMNVEHRTSNVELPIMNFLTIRLNVEQSDLHRINLNSCYEY